MFVKYFAKKKTLKKPSANFEAFRYRIYYII